MDTTERIVPGTRTPGWNDPPPLKIKTKAVKAPEITSLQPITHPLFGSAVLNGTVPPTVPIPSNGVAGNVDILDTSAPVGIALNLKTLQLKPALSNGVHNSDKEVANGIKDETTEESKVEFERGKRKLSVEDFDLVNNLQNLREQCYNVCSKPQMKKKLEDMARKFDILSESLRNDKVSKVTLDDLRNIVNAIHEKDHEKALNLHTDLVACGNFTEISTALPAIKVLIQYAVQLGVFV